MTDSFQDLFNRINDKPQTEKLRKQTLWSDGRCAVVRGPFPEGFSRTLTTKTLALAIKTKEAHIGPRGVTTTSQYAKVRLADIAETHNEWGEISP